MTFTYDSSGSVIAMTYNGTQYFYKKNGQGDIIGIVDATGTVVINYSYDSWGKLLSVTGNTELGNANPFRYRGYYYDVETGWYYLNSRYYNPEVGRFISADTVTDGGLGVIGNNLFIYGANNPVTNLDSSGNGIIKSAIKWLTKNVVNPVVKKVKRTFAKIDRTYSKGSGVSVSLGSSGSMNYSVQLGYSVDTKGNIAIQSTFSQGVSTGSFGATLFQYTTKTNAKTVENLEDYGGQFGGSVSFPLVGVPYVVGKDINVIPNSENLGKPYWGITTIEGIGTDIKALSGEGHVSIGYTKSFIKMNIYDTWNKVYIGIMEW